MSDSERPESFQQPYSGARGASSEVAIEFLGSAPDEPKSAAGNRGPKAVIAIVVVLLLAVGGLVAYHFAGGTSSSGSSGPDDAVSAYFKAVESGDAKSAVALATGPYQGTPLVSAAALANVVDRPSGFSIVSTKTASAAVVSAMQAYGVNGHDFTYVFVKYSVDATVLSDTYLAEQDAQTSKWLLVNPYEQLSVTGGWSNTVIVDGAAVTEGQDVEVFPGGHVVADPSSPDFAPDSTTVYPSDGQPTPQNPASADSADGGVSALIGQVTLMGPSLSAAGTQAAQTAYSTALDACATQADTGHGVCGIDDTYNGYTCNHVTWTITRAATVRVDMSPSGSDFDISASGSIASESGDYTDDLTNADVAFANQSTTLETSYGSIVFHTDGSATVTLAT